ncbi:MAG: hypothetical protein IKP31_06045 [Lachnospiraceae bacterium]|nr:hypothetical protein [Lachnospiraceae bacterium]
MERELLGDKQLSARKYEKLAVTFGVISLAGLICCFPIMPVLGGLGIIFALISRGGSADFSKEAKKGLTFSIIGTAASLLLTVGLLGYSMYFTFNELKTNDKLVDEMREQYEQIYDRMGTEMPPEMEEMLDRLEEMSEEYRNR